MKHYLFFFIIGIIAFSMGCNVKGNSSQTLTVPNGKFIGEFRLLHRAQGNIKFDTTKANITLNMVTPGNTFVLTGDTATVHAGSHGTFTFGPQYMGFIDVTYPKTGVPTKTHLNGGYLYYYDGNILQLLAYSVDTLSLQYDLKKQTGN